MSQVIDIKRPEKWRDTVSFLRNIADKIEKGELPKVTMGTMALVFDTGELANYGFGPECDDLQMVAVSAMAHHILLQDMTGI